MPEHFSAARFSLLERVETSGLSRNSFDNGEDEDTYDIDEDEDIYDIART